MKKITLIAIVISALFIGIIFLGSKLEQTTKRAGSVAKSRIVLLNNTNKPPLGEKYHINSPQININDLKFSPVSAPPGSFTWSEVSKHNSRANCYLVINNNVYDVSSYISYHPGGSRVITSRCGKGVTGIFASIHSNRAWDLLRRYKIGTIAAKQSNTTYQALTIISAALKKANPQANVIKVRPKTNFYVAKISYQGKLYEVHINRQGQIFKEELESDEPNWFFWENDNDDK